MEKMSLHTIDGWAENRVGNLIEFESSARKLTNVSVRLSEMFRIGWCVTLAALYAERVRPPF